MKSIAIITARGGSKRIPGKNIKLFNAKPIIAYSIEAAMSSALFDEVMVSTDSDEIAQVSKKFGAVIPFVRSSENSNDFATTADVLTEVLCQYKKAEKVFEYACCLYPTAPFVTAGKLRRAFELLVRSDADSVIPVSKYNPPIWRSLRKNEQNKITYNWPEHAQRRSQDLADTFYDCGQFYFFRVDRFLQTGNLISDNTIGFEIPFMEAQDIDNEEDWRIAEFKYTYYLHQFGFNN